MLGTALLDRLSRSFAVTATDIVKGYSPQVVEWRIADLLDNMCIQVLLEAAAPDVIVHCAAIVNVDACDLEPQSARSVHRDATELMVTYASEHKAKLIYISTDSVFDGKKESPYVEEDEANPLNIYAQTKLEGEAATLLRPNNTVLRTNIFGWSRSNSLSFAEWILRGLITKEKLTMFDDVYFAPIHVTHLADIIMAVIKKDIAGLYHAAGSTVLSKYDFARTMARHFSLPDRWLCPVSVEKSGLIARRPKNMALDSGKMARLLDYQIPGVSEGIKLMKMQYDSGWVAAIKGRLTLNDYRFWEI